MAEIRYAVPMVTSIDIVKNPIQPTEVTKIYINEPKARLVMNVKYYIAGLVSGREQMIFEDDVYDTISTNASAAFAGLDLAFNDLTEAFNITKESSSNANTGVKMSLVPEKWSACLEGNKKVSVIIGVYKEGVEKALNYFELSWLDAQGFVARDLKKAEYDSMIESQQKIIDGDYDVNYPDESPADRATRKARAAEMKLSFQQQKQDYIANEAFIGNFVDLVAIPTVLQAFAGFCQACFAYLIATNPNWSSIVLTELMTLFASTMNDIVAAEVAAQS